MSNGALKISAAVFALVAVAGTATYCTVFDGKAELPQNASPEGSVRVEPQETAPELLAPETLPQPVPPAVAPDAVTRPLPENLGAAFATQITSSCEGQSLAFFRTTTGATSQQNSIVQEGDVITSDHTILLNGVQMIIEFKQSATGTDFTLTAPDSIDSFSLKFSEVQIGDSDLNLAPLSGKDLGVIVSGYANCIASLRAPEAN